MTGVLPNPFEVIYRSVDGSKGEWGLNRAFDLLFEEIFKAKNKESKNLVKVSGILNCERVIQSKK